MSEKQVNIKITASTKDFDNAIKKAQKQIEGLADAIDSLGSSKFGNKIEDQFNGLVTAIKEIETRVASMLDSLGNVNNTKLGKVEDEVNDITEAVDKFSTKAKDMVDTLDKVDKQELNGLENEVNNVRDVVDKMDKEVRVASDNMADNFKDVTNNIDRAGNSIDDLAKKFKNADGSINYDNILKYAGSIENADKIMKELLDSQGNLNKAINEVDTKKINDYYESLTNIKDVTSKVENLLQNTFDNIKGKVNLDFNGKDGNKGLASNITEGLLTGAIAGKTMENAIEGVTSELKDMTKQMEGLSAPEQLIQPFVELSKGFEKVQGDMDALVKRYAELDEEQKELTESQKKFKESNDLTNEAIDLAEKQMYKYAEQAKELDKAIEKAREDQLAYSEAMNNFDGQLLAVTDKMEEQKEVVDQLGKEYDKAVEEVNRYAKASEYINKLAEEGIDKNTKVKFTDGNYNMVWSSLEHALEAVNVQFEKAKQNAAELGDELSKENNSLNVLEKEREAIEKQKNALDEQYKAVGKTEEEIEQMTEAWQDANKQAEKFQDLMTKLRDIDIDEAINMEFIQKNFKESVKDAEKLEKQMAEVTEEYLKLNQAAQGEVGEFNKKYKAYEKLSESVKEYLKDEEKSILLREKVAKSFQKTADAMEKVYAGASKYNNADLITETLQEAAKYVKELDLVSTENLQSDLERLGKIIEDKTDKIKRFKELNKEFGSEASKAGYGLEKQSESLRDFADSTGFVLEATNTLKKAWGDISAAGEDHLKIRERSELLDDYGDKLKKNIAIIKSHHKELKTLDEIYEKATDKEKATIDDYKAWEKNEAKLREYNDALRDYFSILKDTNGQVDSKFLDELGKFDVKKFIADFDKMGTSSMVLSKQINAVKIELTESIKQYKDNADAARDNAKAIADNAKEVLDAAKAKRDDIQAQVDHAKKTAQTATSMEEAAQATKAYKEDSKKLAEAIKEVEQAQEDYNQATKDADNWDDRRLQTLKEQIQEYNRLAAAMREIGMAANDLGKADIAKFDRSLASMLDRLDTFDDDIPKTFADIKEDIKALFSDMDSLDFGGVFDGLKEIGAGILSKIPGEAKVAAAAIAGITIALKECAEAGVNQFTRGMDTVKGAISGIVNVARNIGQEIGDAFSNITGMELDFSSLMEIPVNFESQMAKVGAIAGVEKASEAFKELEEEARRLGATTRYSATEVAEAMEYMGMAGWTNTQILAKSKDGLSALESVLKLATVAQMDLGQASDFVTDGLTALGMEAEEASYMVNILAAASTSSNTTVAQMQRAFTNCAPVAGTLGINIKDLSMALGLMADKGVKGAKAGTALKNLMANLSAPTEKQLEYIKAFNLQGAQQAIVNGDLLGGLKQMKAALSSLTPQQKNAVITTIAGKEALSGISALLNTTEADLNELESALDNCDGAAKRMAEGFDDTLEGALKGLASAMQETLLQIFDKTEESIKSVTKELTEFFHILNGFSDHNGVKGLAGALEYLEEVSQGWGKAITDGITNAIGAIDEFVNSASFDNLLQIGTNIINGIANGIKNAADNGTLGSAISTAIGKIATWFSENLDTVVEVGKEVIDAISQGISENGPAIGKAIRAVMELQTEIDKAVAKEKWKLIGDNLVSFICEGIESKVSVFISALSGFFSTGVTEALGKLGDLFISTGSTLLFDPIMSLGKKIGEWLRDAILDHFDINLDGVFSSIGDKISGVLPWGKDKKKSSGSSKGSSKAPTVDTSSSPIDIINSNLSSGKSKTDATAASIGEGISSNITSKLETMDAAGLQALNTEMQSLQKTVTSLGNGMASSFKVIQDSARTSFMGLTNIIRNQMLNCTNIIRNQMLNMTNIVVNQTKNSRDAFTRQFMSMAAVARTQMVNVSNIISNQARSWYNVINNQITNARNAFTSQMISMAKVASTQMNKISSTIKSSMDSIGENIGSGVSSGLSKSSSSISNSSNNFKNTLVNNFKKAFGIHSPSTVMRDEVGVNLALGIEEGLNTGANNISTSVDGIVSTINNGISGINTYDGSGLITINASEAAVTNKAMKSLIVTLTEVGSYIDNAGLAFKTFVKTLSLISENISVSVMAFQKLAKTLMSIVETINQATVSFAAFGKSITDISEDTTGIRESFMGIANIVNNQETNARNAFTQQFMSMEAVSRTQMSKVTEAIRSNAINWSNIINNQAKNARDNFTRQFMSMASVCSTQMAKCLSSVKSYMSKIASATNKKMSMSLNVNRNVSTSYAAAAGASIMSADALYAANSASTYSLGGSTGALASRASSAVSSGSNASNGGGRGNSNYTIIEVPVNLDGKQIAKASAKYVDNELKTMANRENRKRGAK